MFRSSRGFGRASRSLAPWILLAVGAWPAAAAAESFSLDLEHGGAIPLSESQSTRFDDGLAESLSARFGVTRYLDVGPTASYLFLPYSPSTGMSGTAWAFGAGARVQRPHDAVDYGSVSPWVAFDALYMRTDGLDRPGFNVAVGVALPLDNARALWAGPLIRYTQTSDPARAGYDTRDAKILIIGFNVEIGNARRSAALPTGGAQ